MIKELAEYCGEERYKKFLDALGGGAKRNGRLFYWQEKLLDDFNASLGTSIPTDLEGLLAHYRCPSVILDVDPSAGMESVLKFEKSCSRTFRWENRYASGGSQATIFTLEMMPKNSRLNIEISDRAAPHADRNTASRLIEEIANGVRSFMSEQKNEGGHVLGFDVLLRWYAYDEIDLKPHKYASATKFILEDLLCEQSFGRFIQTKIVGVPV